MENALENGTAIISMDAPTDTTIRDFTREALEVARNTICKDLTDAEFAYASAICRATGLNPLKKEIWFWKDHQGRLIAMTGVNGYFEVANRHPQYDGMEEDVVCDEKTGKPIYAWCRVYRKDRKFPQEAKAYFAEYADTRKPLWNAKPRIMLQKVAESLALRKAFPQELNGTYTEEEMPSEHSLKTGEKLREVGDTIVVPGGSAEVVAKTEPKEKESKKAEIDWSSFKFVYDVRASRDKFKDIAARFKENGGKFRRKKNFDGSINPDGDNLWYCNVFLDEFSKWVKDNPLYDSPQKELFDGDNVPWEN